MKSVLLSILLAAAAAANAMFTAPAGCAAIAPSPDVTGVQCFGSFTDGGDPGQAAQGSFSGTGVGVLWASSVTFDYDLTSSSLITRSVQVSATVNDGIASQFFLSTLGTATHSGSLTIPINYGAALTSWSINFFNGTATPDGSKTIDIPTSGIGVRLLVNHDPPSTPVPEPATALTLALGAAGIFLLHHRFH
jgi:hypothetical protein